MKASLGIPLALLCAPLLAHAEAPAPAPASAPAPYALPWQLRPAAPVNVLRLDDTFAVHDGGRTNAAMLLGSYKVAKEWSPFVRLPIVTNSPENGAGGTTVANPLVGLTWGRTFAQDFRLAVSLAATVPVGQGGGNEPDAVDAATTRAGVLDRSAMDNALFSVNDFTVIPGIDLAWVKGGLTVQAEATLLQLTRVRGEAVQKDESRTNFTSGLFVGGFVTPQVSLGAELRYQRWLSTPVAVAANEGLRDNLTGAVGVRAHVKLNDHLTLRPGLSVAAGLHGPASDQHYRVVQVDLPLNF